MNMPHILSIFPSPSPPTVSTFFDFLVVHMTSASSSSSSVQPQLGRSQSSQSCFTHTGEGDLYDIWFVDSIIILIRLLPSFPNDWAHWIYPHSRQSQEHATRQQRRTHGTLHNKKWMKTFKLLFDSFRGII